MNHQPVLLAEVLEGFAPKKEESFIDATLGLGGHTKALLEATAPNGRVLGLDWDEQAQAQARQNLAPFQSRVVYELANYRQLVALAKAHHFTQVKGILFDLGMGSWQFDDLEYGFSLNSEQPLDFRYLTTGRTAYDIVNRASIDQLCEILRTYGDEPSARAIARLITNERARTKIATVKQLADLIKARFNNPTSKIHPATRTLQALRIYVNDELNNLEQTLNEVIDHFDHTILAVISFHSGEDRVVKNVFKDRQHELSLITKKPIVPQDTEIRRNPRARSAKLRLAKIIKEKNINDHQ